MACYNNAPPMSLPWKNNSVTRDNSVFHRGVQMGVGTPAQLLSFTPTFSSNDIWIYNIDYCGSTTNTSCIGPVGGVFNASASQTFSSTIQQQWNGSFDSEDQGTFINDRLIFGSNGTLYGFPMLEDRPGYGTMSGLGLGWNSTFLSAVTSGGFAPTKSYGLWAGSSSDVKESINGLLVLGGYDSSRVTQQFTQFQSYQQCPTCFSVVNMTWNDAKSGNHYNLFPNSTYTFSAGLEPFESVLELPTGVYRTFMNVTNATADYNLQDWTWPANNPPKGNLTITVQGKTNYYNTIIPVEELFTYMRSYAKGPLSITNTSVLVSNLNPITPLPNIVYSFGLPFLTMNYLAVLPDAGIFQMSPANRYDDSANQSPTIQKLCTGLGAVSTTTLPTTSIATATASVAPISTSSAATSSSSTSTGAIVGGVVGGLGGLALILLAAFFFWRRNKRRQQPPPPAGVPVQYHQSAGMPPQSRPAPAWGPGPKSEMSESTATELPSPNPREQMVRSWASSQTTPYPVEELHSVGATMQEPFEMPASIPERRV